MLLLPSLDAVSAASTVTACLASLVLLVTVVQQLWRLRWSAGRDKSSALPLPKGSMGFPVVGETFHWMVQGSRFHASRRERYGNVFKTHLLGRPVVRVTGAENVRRVLMGEHALVSSQWPLSTRLLLGANSLGMSVGDAHRNKRKVMAQVFSHAALEGYLPQVQLMVRAAVSRWRDCASVVTVYPECKTLTFRVALHVVVSSRIAPHEEALLADAFEQFVENFFSLPLDVPFSGLRKGLKARKVLHGYLDKLLRDKLERPEFKESQDAMDILISSAKEHGKEMSMLELKEAAVELIFAAHATTASASTSLVLQMLKHPDTLARLRRELADAGLGGGPAAAAAAAAGTAERPPLTLGRLVGLRYLDCVVKEVLRLLPPVSGGYRTALKTFELEGCQIPKGWSVLYSIRDTHETAPAFSSPLDFDPDRFDATRAEDSKERFSYLPFGGGVRSCLGKELAKLILKVLAVELAGGCTWELASAEYPRMQTVPIVHPVDGLHVRFKALPTDEGVEKKPPAVPVAVPESDDAEREE
ncbi:cytochrome P450 26B1-like [Petromyzon marinus]|uniref:Cytochrome P450 26B1-like n=1 Tax=Petromyzon marinus TaxID=7757 RepID=A0AAJ7SYJ7_PETMA|nr:cytochrome P450 26B1-like [Petromyzon marinus]XP_032808018.1 cytochrome P450 26B1-like [Petromyzon marinus]